METNDGLRFYRSGAQASPSSTSPDLEEVVGKKAKVRKRKVKLLVGGNVIVGKSSYREHLRKTAKMTEIRSFLEKADTKCCEHINGLCRNGMLR